MKKKVAIFCVTMFMFSGLSSTVIEAKQLTTTSQKVVSDKENEKKQINENEGVFSDTLLDEVGKLIKDYKVKNPKTSEDEIVKVVAEDIANRVNNINKVGATSSTDYLDSLITGSLGPTEKNVFNSNPLFGAYVLADAKLAADSAAANYTDLHNGKGDAYRHGLWQGLSAFHVGATYAKSFGDAHEKDFPGPAIETTMDLFNNSVGRGIGSSKWTIWTVYSGVSAGITAGSFKYIKNGVLVYTNK